jgi:hypothetical protein
MRDIVHGGIRNQLGPLVAGVLSGITTPTTKGPADVTLQLTRASHPAEAGCKRLTIGESAMCERRRQPKAASSPSVSCWWHVCRRAIGTA